MDLSKCPEDKPFLSSTCEYISRSGDQCRVESDGNERTKQTVDSAYHFARSLFCTTVTDVMISSRKEPTLPSHLIEECIKEIHIQDIAAKDKRMIELLKDLEGQCKEALSRQDYWKKWGKHYLPSLCRAHQLQQCNNFKDPGVQVYGGKLFEKLRDIADDIFLKIPAPKPSIKKRDGSSYKPVQSMNVYYNSAAVCFSGDSLVQMKDGSFVRCDNIIPGDLVGVNGRKVKCVVKTKSLNGLQTLVQLSSTIKATPWHPVLHNGKWEFPVNIAPAKIERCDATYNFVLEDSSCPEDHTMSIGGFLCATLGHGVTSNPSDVRSSEFWGKQIIEDLKQLEGWKDGYIVISSPVIQRNLETGLVCKLKDQIPAFE